MGWGFDAGEEDPTGWPLNPKITRGGVHRWGWERKSSRVRAKLDLSRPLLRFQEKTKKKTRPGP